MPDVPQISLFKRQFAASLKSPQSPSTGMSSSVSPCFTHVATWTPRDPLYHIFVVPVHELRFVVSVHDYSADFYPRGARVFDGQNRGFIEPRPEGDTIMTESPQALIMSSSMIFRSSQRIGHTIPAAAFDAEIVVFFKRAGEVALLSRRAPADCLRFAPRGAATADFCKHRRLGSRAAQSCRLRARRNPRRRGRVCRRAPPPR